MDMYTKDSMGVFVRSFVDKKQQEHKPPKKKQERKIVYK